MIRIQILDKWQVILIHKNNIIDKNNIIEKGEEVDRVSGSASGDAPRQMNQQHPHKLTEDKDGK